MSARKFASLTPELLVIRKGDAAPSIITAPPPCPFPSSSPALAKSRSDDSTCCASLDLRILVPGSSAFIAVKSETGLAELARVAPQMRAEAFVVPVEITPNPDGSVELSFADSGETFAYSAAEAGWVGAEGAFITGGSNLFDRTNGWSLVVSVDRHRFTRVEICRNETRQAVALNGFG